MLDDKCYSDTDCSSKTIPHNNLRKPNWLKLSLRHSAEFTETSQLVQKHQLNTICSSGKCPNITECWSRRVATFMIGGNICTRDCKFCATKTGKPLPLDTNEPIRVARSIKMMGLRHAVITSVDRDDLIDGGANHWHQTIEAIREENPDTSIEVLIPDLNAQEELLKLITSSSADIIGHNIETVRRLTPLVRSKATYEKSIATLKILSQMGATTKSGLMVGLGETFEEVIETLQNLYDVGVKRATIGQYLQPTKQHYPVVAYIEPTIFDDYATKAKEIGFTHIFSAPLVRSSYMADMMK